LAHQLVRDFYDHFNQRRVAAAGALFAPDAVVDMPPFVPRAHGADAYFQFAATRPARIRVRWTWAHSAC